MGKRRKRTGCKEERGGGGGGGAVVVLHCKVARLAPPRLAQQGSGGVAPLSHLINTL